MKFNLLFSFALFLGAIAPAYSGDILKCLGEEEKKYHVSKKSGPRYDLNQKLIAEVIQIPQVKVKDHFFKQICQTKFNIPSLKLLELSLIEGKNIFIPPQTSNVAQASVNESMIDGYIETSKEIFLEFIASIQVLSPTPNCLKEEIPQLDKFFVEVKHLQDEMDLKDLLKKKDIKIFKELKNYPQAFEKCLERKSKKDKSESTEAPKKS